MRVAISCVLVREQNFGVGRSILGLCTGLASLPEGPELVLYTPGGRAGERFTPLASPRVRLVRAPLARWRATRIAWEQLRLPRDAAASGADVLHMPAYVKPIRTRIPTVLSVFDLLALLRPELCRPLNRRHYRIALPISVRSATRVIVPSRRVRDQIVEHLGVGSDRIDVIPPGYEARLARPVTHVERERIRVRHALPPRYALFLGHAEPKKNLARLLEAFRRLRRSGSDLGLVLAGVEPRAATFARAEGVFALGYLPAEDLPALLQGARMIVFPSLEEGFGLPVLEGMASGVPVVASAVPAAVELGADAVATVEPASEDSIAAAMARVDRDDSLRATLRARGLEASRGLDWEHVAARTLRVYEEVASRRTFGSPPPGFMRESIQRATSGR